MNLDAQPRGSMGVFTDLLRLPPKARLIAGIVCVAGGIGCTVLLWGRGVVWGLTLFATLAGLFLIFSGVGGIRSEKKRREFLESLRRRKQEILQVMIDTKRQGKNPIRYLNEQGIHDPALRTEFLDEMNEALKDA